MYNMCDPDNVKTSGKLHLHGILKYYIIVCHTQYCIAVFILKPLVNEFIQMFYMLIYVSYMFRGRSPSYIINKAIRFCSI